MAPHSDPLSRLSPSGAIAVVAPHPDDETLGCGGLIALAAARGRSLVVVVLTDGSASHPGSALFPPATLAQVRAREVEAALAELGCRRADLILLGLPDGALDRADAAAVAVRLADLFRRRDVGTVFVTGPHDTHPDHRRAFHIAATAATAIGAAVWTYPVRAHVARAPSATGAVTLSIDEVLERKCLALTRHATQLRGGVADAPAGFHLSDEDLAYHLSSEEVFTPAEGFRETRACLLDQPATCGPHQDATKERKS